MNYLLVLFTAFTGALLPVQAGVNSQLARWVGHPISAALISFAVGTNGLFLCWLAMRPALPTWQSVSQAPWWTWTGGVIGMVFVTGAAAFAPKLGASVFVAITVAAQIIASMALDHFGLVGFEKHPLNLPRVLGAALLIGGVWLIQKN